MAEGEAMKKINLDVYNLKEPEKAHEYLREQFNFSDYYGKNLDALYDCLTDLHNLEITFIHTGQAEEYAKRVITVFQDAAREDNSLMIRLEK